MTFHKSEAHADKSSPLADISSKRVQESRGSLEKGRLRFIKGESISALCRSPNSMKKLTGFTG